MWRCALALAGFLFASPVFAAPAFTPGETVTVDSVNDGETLTLGDHRIVRLVGIDAPSRGPLADEAKTALETLLASGPVALRFAGNARDRQGRVLAQIYAGDVWVQGALLQRGLARVRSTADNRIGIADMLKLERAARRYRRGLWADRAYAVRAPAEVPQFAGSFQLVSGAVADVHASGGTVYVTLGADRRALTLTIDAEAMKLCRAAGFDPKTLAGQTILVRGFIDGAARPRLAVTHPEQIELLKTQKKKARDASPGPDP